MPAIPVGPLDREERAQVAAYLGERLVGSVGLDVWTREESTLMAISLTQISISTGTTLPPHRCPLWDARQQRNMGGRFRCTAKFRARASRMSAS